MLSVDLIQLAKKERPAKGKVNMDQYMPVITILRGKGFSYDRIYDWLKEHGEYLQKERSTFRSAASKRYKRMLARETKK